MKHQRESIQPQGKMKYDLNMLDQVTETPVMPTAATITEDSYATYN